MIIVVLASTLMFLYTPIGGKLYSGTSFNGGFISDINFNDKSFHTTERLPASSSFSSHEYVRPVSQQAVYASNKHGFNAVNGNNTIGNNTAGYQTQSHSTNNSALNAVGSSSASGMAGGGLKSSTNKADVNTTASSNSSFVLLTDETQRSSVTTSSSSLNLADNGADPQKATLDESVPVSDGILPLFILLISYSTFLFFRNKN